MTEQALVDEDITILDDYFDTIHAISSSPVCDYKKRDIIYTELSKLLVGRVQYVRGCDPNKNNGKNHARSISHTLAILISALADCPDNSQEDVQTMNVNYFLDKLYKEICDPLCFSFVTFSGFMTLIHMTGIEVDDKSKSASTADIVELVTKAKKDGKLKAYTVGDSGEIDNELSDDDLDSLLDDWIGDGDVTCH